MAKAKPMGRPPLDLEEVVQKLAPYLQRGLSVRKACLEAHVPHSQVYAYMKTNEEFSDKIKRLQQYKSVLYADIRLYQLSRIFKKVNEARRMDEDVELTPQENSLLEWFGEQDKSLREEWGQKIDIGSEEGSTVPVLISDPEALKIVIKSFARVADKLRADEK